MTMSIQTNMGALSAQRNLFTAQKTIQGSFERLSSGYRITRASDDAAGLGVAANLDAQIRSYAQAVRNAQDGVSVAQVAEGALGQIHNNLARMRELAMQSASDGVGDGERAYIQAEFTAIVEEIGRVAETAEFNGQMLLSDVDTLDFQVGVRSTDNDKISIDTIDLMAEFTPALDTLTVLAKDDTGAALDGIDAAINTVSEFRANFGVFANRLEQASSNAQVAGENLAASHSRIRDVDVATETSNLAVSQVLQMAGVSVLAQANTQPQIAMRLLG